MEVWLAHEWAHRSNTHVFFVFKNYVKKYHETRFIEPFSAVLYLTVSVFKLHDNIRKNKFSACQKIV